MHKVFTAVLPECDDGVLHADFATVYSYIGGKATHAGPIGKGGGKYSVLGNEQQLGIQM